MEIYLVQHANAVDTEVDPDRPLSEKGWKDIYRISAFLSKTERIVVTEIVHSGKTRARQTAEALGEALQPAKGVRAVDGLAPLDDPAPWAARLSEVEDNIMVVGHLPFVSRLASLMLRQDPEFVLVRFRQGGVVCLGTDESGAWSVRWMLIPDLLP